MQVNNFKDLLERIKKREAYIEVLFYSRDLDKRDSIFFRITKLGWFLAGVFIGIAVGYNLL